MKIDPNATDRVVLVAAGFGVWHGGRHQASARWTDVARVRAVREGGAATGRIRLAVALDNATEVLIHEQVPGYASFLGAAERSLRGMIPRTSWMASLHEATGAGGEVVLFERPARGR